MNDLNSFNKILVANNPSSVKELGRQVINWDQKLWDIHVCLIAKEVIEAKFQTQHWSLWQKQRKKIYLSGSGADS